MEELFKLLAKHGGSIVSSNDLHPDLINQARASNRMWVDENSLGYVWEPKFARLFPTTDEEVEMFEWCYPIKPELPDKLKDVSFLFDKDRIRKTLNKPHPSDSDIGICRMFNEIALLGEETEPRASYITQHQAEEALMELRDRMNGEMCEFLEWAEENDYQRGGLPEKLWFKWEELKVIDIPYTTEQLLQKFRNRDL